MDKKEIFSAIKMDDPRSFLIAVMAKNNFKSSQDLSHFLKSLPYCSAPWLHSHINPEGERKLCCVATASGMDFNTSFDEYWNSEYMQNVREKMLNHNPPEECKKCIHHVGPRAHRSLYLHLLLELPELMDLKWEKIALDRPISLDYRINRHCNYACRMCTSTASSSILKIEKEAKVEVGTIRITDEIFKDLKAEYFHLLSNEKILDINFADGEPFISKLHWEIIHYLIDKKISPKVMLRYSSNLSIVNYQGIDIGKYLSEHFNKVYISISIDGTGEVAEFVRDGLKWNLWLKNYEVIRNTLGEKNIRFHITVTIPVLLDIENVANFLDKENIDFSLTSANPIGNELLLSPLTLDKKTKELIINSKLSLIKNKKIIDYLNDLLSTDNSTELGSLKSNFSAIRTYYLKIDWSSGRKSTINYLSEREELCNWWSEICPAEFRSKPIKKNNASNFLKKYVPNEIGRFFYKLIFYIYRFYLQSKYQFKIKIWFRNSINENFFKFAESDLDLSIKYNNDDFYLKNSEKIQNDLLILPMVKEINSYSPRGLGLLVGLINSLELRRDPILLQHLDDRKIKSEEIDHDKVFLLRMLIANINHAWNGLSDRNAKKWKYYFKLCGASYQESEFMGKSFEFLVITILNFFGGDSVKYKDDLIRISFYYLNKIPIYILFDDLEFKNQMITWFPQIFCSLDLRLVETTENSEFIYLEQISWEISSYISQAVKENSLTQVDNHLINIKKILQASNKMTTKAETRKQYLLDSVNRLQSFMLAPNHKGILK